MWKILGCVALAVSTMLADGGAIAAQSIEGCFLRAYDAAHLAKNPKQMVRRFFLRGPRGTDGDYFDISVQLRNDKSVYEGGAKCESEGAGLRCRADDTQRPNGYLRLNETKDGLRLELDDAIQLMGESGPQELKPRKIGGPADKVFLLRRAPEKDCK